MNFSIIPNAVNVILFSSVSLVMLLGPGASLAKEPGQAKVTNPTPFKASYELYRGGSKIGKAVYSLQHVGNNNYILKGNGSLSGMLSLLPNVTASVKSNWRYVNGNIQPVRYRYRTSVTLASKKMVSVFDWSRHVATVTHNKVVRKIPLEDGDLDQSLVPLAVMLDMKRQKLRDEYRYVDRRRIKKYKFKIIGQEQIDTKLGRFEAVLVETIQKSKKRKKVKRRTMFWSVPKLDYLPVRITHKSGDGTEVVMSLTRLRGELGYRLTENNK